MPRFLLLFVLIGLTACSSKPDSPLADDADWERGAANPMVSQQA